MLLMIMLLHPILIELFLISGIISYFYVVATLTDRGSPIGMTVGTFCSTGRPIDTPIDMRVPVDTSGGSCCSTGGLLARQLVCEYLLACPS